MAQRTDDLDLVLDRLTAAREGCRRRGTIWWACKLNGPEEQWHVVPHSHAKHPAPWHWIDRRMSYPIALRVVIAANSELRKIGRLSTGCCSCQDESADVWYCETAERVLRNSHYQHSDARSAQKRRRRTVQTSVDIEGPRSVQLRPLAGRVIDLLARIEERPKTRIIERALLAYAAAEADMVGTDLSLKAAVERLRGGGR